MPNHVHRVLPARVQTAWPVTPAAGSGVVLVFRRPDALATTTRFTLHGLEAGTQYRIEDFDVSGKRLLSGETLMLRGLKVSLSEAPASAIVQYVRQSG